jgi:hypothetical protein
MSIYGFELGFKTIIGQADSGLFFEISNALICVAAIDVLARIGNKNNFFPGHQVCGARLGRLNLWYGD